MGHVVPVMPRLKVNSTVVKQCHNGQHSLWNDELAQATKFTVRIVKMLSGFAEDHKIVLALKDMRRRLENGVIESDAITQSLK